jgi:hypothetical protein
VSDHLNMPGDQRAIRWQPADLRSRTLGPRRIGTSLWRSTAIRARSDLGDMGDDRLQCSAIYRYTPALLHVRPYPRGTDEQRQRFTDAINALHSRVVMQPTAEWEGPDQARVTLACHAEDTSSAAERAKAIIERNAANVAHIYVKDVDVIETATLEE